MGTIYKDTAQDKHLQGSKLLGKIHHLQQTVHRIAGSEFHNTLASIKQQQIEMCFIFQSNYELDSVV